MKKMKAANPSPTSSAWPKNSAFRSAPDPVSGPVTLNQSMICEVGGLIHTALVAGVRVGAADERMDGRSPAISKLPAVPF